MRDFRKLQVWHTSHHIALATYHVTRSFPKDEQFGIVSQMRRASYSIPSNIAEGCGRDSDAELARFMTIAMGSASELEYFNLLAKDLEYLTLSDFENLNVKVIEVKRMLAPFIKRLKADG